jgi:hypothetical protein
MKCEELQRETKLHVVSLYNHHCRDLNVSSQKQKQRCASAEQFVLQAICDAVHSALPFAVKHDTQCTNMGRSLLRPIHT